MKVVRLRRGYRITCTDSEFEVLNHLISYGMPEMAEHQVDALFSPTAKRAYNSDRFRANWSVLNVDEDRRGETK